MRKIVSLVLAICVFAYTFLCLQVSAADDIEIYLFGKKVECDVAPVIENGRTLVPVRVISEKGLGAEVFWDGEKQQVTIVKDDFSVILTIGNKRATVDGQEKFLDVPAKLISDRTMVPVRFVSEAFNYKVDWDNTNRRVVIDEDKKQESGKDDEEKEEEENLSISTISVKRSKTNTTLKVSMSEYKKPKIFTLKEPYRIVLDFENYTFADGDDSIDVGTEYVKQIRHARNDGFYRIVIECVQECEYEYDKTSSNGFSLVVVGDAVSNKDNEDTEEEEEKQEDEEEEEEEERKAPKKPESMESVVIVIDAGHGGKDPGALGTDEDGNVLYNEDDEAYIKEKDINLAVAKKVYGYLDKKGVKTILTRSKDVYLELRDIADIANEEEATLFVSIHCNSVDGISTAKGVEVLYFDKETDADFGITSKKLADNILNEMLDNVDTFDRGLKERPGLAVLKWTEMPAALVELGFVTNAIDQERLLNEAWQNGAAKAIAEGILKSVESMID